MNITSKNQMFELYSDLSFGNRFEYWSDLNEFWRSGYHGLVGCRYREIGSLCVKTQMTHGELLHYLDIWVKSGYSRDLITISGQPPLEACYLLNAEIMRSTSHLDVTYSLANAPMRPALKCSTNYASMLESELLLRRYLDQASYENLQRLLDTYPDHVIELSVFDQSVGVLGCNTIFWEVRYY